MSRLPRASGDQPGAGAGNVVYDGLPRASGDEPCAALGTNVVLRAAPREQGMNRDVLRELARPADKNERIYEYSGRVV